MQQPKKYTCEGCQASFDTSKAKFLHKRKSADCRLKKGIPGVVSLVVDVSARRALAVQKQKLKRQEARKAKAAQQVAPEPVAAVESPFPDLHPRFAETKCTRDKNFDHPMLSKYACQSFANHYASGGNSAMRDLENHQALARHRELEKLGLLDDLCQSEEEYAYEKRVRQPPKQFHYKERGPARYNQGNEDDDKLGFLDPEDDEENDKEEKPVSPSQIPPALLKSNLPLGRLKKLFKTD